MDCASCGRANPPGARFCAGCGVALARFDELTAAAPSAPRIENTAARTMEGFASAWEARDWERFAALFSAGFRGIDHPRFAIPYLGRDQHLEALRIRFAMSSSRLTLEMLATRGDRLVLVRSHWEGADRDVGPSETETLLLCEVDERGDLVKIVYFEPDDFDAAYAKLDERYAAGEAAACARVSATMQSFTRAFAARDWDALAALFAPDLVANDHRLLGWETLHGPAAYVETLRSLVDLAPDARLRLDHLWMTERGLLWAGAWVGTRDGGAFETPWITVSEHGDRGAVLRFDQYDLDQLATALARFAELRPDPLRIPPNAASRLRDRTREALFARDWDSLRALTSDDFRFEDRTRHALIEGDVEMLIESNKFIRAAQNLRLAITLIGTAGERIAIERIITMGGPDGSPFEVDRLCLSEVDAAGKLLAQVSFEVDDRRAAFEEMGACFAGGEAVAIGGQAPIVAFDRAFARDGDLLRTCIADDAVVCDRSSLSLLGTLDRDEYVASVTAFADLAPDLEVESFRILTWNGRGRVDLARRFGTRDGGQFENFFTRVFLTAGDRIQRFEIFDVDAADTALARFAELCADRE